MKNSLLSSRLYDNNNFYKFFKKDLVSARHSVIIESPFITTKRMDDLMPMLLKLRMRGIRIVVNTRSPYEHDFEYSKQVVRSIARLQDIGVTVLYTGRHHRKLAIIDKEILWEGSLNILSQSSSCEIMRRIYSEQLALQMLMFTKVEAFLEQ